MVITPGEWYASDQLARTSTGFRQMDDIPHVIGAVKLDCSTVWGFPQIDSAAVGCGAVELDDLNFRRRSFPPDEVSARRKGDYIWLAPLASSSVCARTVTGSLLFGSSHILRQFSLFTGWRVRMFRSVVFYKRQLAVVCLTFALQLGQ